MWDWLRGGLGAHPKLGPKQLSDTIDRLLGSAAQGDDAFPLPEKELKRLCNAARWGRTLHPELGPPRRWLLRLLRGTPLLPPPTTPPPAASCRDALLKEPTLLQVSTANNVVVVGGQRQGGRGPGWHAWLLLLGWGPLPPPISAPPCAPPPAPAPPPPQATCTASSTTCSASSSGWGGPAATARCGCSWGTTSTGVGGPPRPRALWCSAAV